MVKMLAIYFALLATLLGEGFAFPPIEDDMSIFFHRTAMRFGERIVGGTEAAEGSYPWIVALSVGARAQSLHCSGSLISEQHILTAAHCIRGPLDSTLLAHIGAHRWASEGDVYTLKQNVIHPDYNHDLIKNDLGILTTNNKVALNDRVKVVNLNFNWIGAAFPSKIAGWGSIWAGGPGSDVLLELNVNTFDADLCVTEVSRLQPNAPPVDPQIEMCTYHSFNHGTCHGDSGGPLVSNSNDEQIGIVSWGEPCARGIPDVFVRISAFQDWITDNMK